MTISPVCHQEHSILYVQLLGLSFSQKDWGTCYSSVPFTLLAFTFLLLIPKTPKKLSFSACSYFFARVTYQYLLLLVGFDTLIYQKCYNRYPTVEGHQVLFSGAVAGERSAISK